MDRIEGISDEVNHVFEISSLVYVWGELEKVIPNLPALVEQCWKEHYHEGSRQSDRTFFLKYGVRVLNPIINRSLNRPLDYPTSFDEIMKIALKDIIRKDQDLYRYLKKLQDASDMERNSINDSK